MGPASFSSYFFLSPFLGFLPSLIFALRASNHFSALSLSLPLLDVLPPSPMKCRPKHQGKPISIAVVSFSFSFLICDLMVDSAVVVWVMDLAVWIWPTWASALRVDRRGLSAKSSEWVSDWWVSNCVGLSRGLFFFFLFRLLVVMRLWICDLVVILEGCFSFSFSGCWWWMVMRLWVWVCDLVMILVVSGHGCGWWWQWQLL